MMKKSMRVMALVLVLILGLTLWGCAADPEDTTPRDDAVPPYANDTQPIETLPPVKVSMPAYELTYSGELKDILVVQELEEANALSFRVTLSGGEAEIFILRFNHEQGELVQVFTDGSGQRIPVAFEMMPLPAGLDQDDEALFCQAQDAVNEIIASMKLK
jgi:hypothetical protein